MNPFTWFRRFLGPTANLTTEELGGEDFDHLPRDVRACTSGCDGTKVREGCPVHDPKRPQ